MHNLAGDPKFATELNRHRKLDAWLAKGDKGEGEESPNAPPQRGRLARRARGEPGV